MHAVDRDGRDETLLEVGRVVRPHGLHGEVIVSLSTNREERVAPGSQLTDGGGRTLRVEKGRPYKGRYLVSFEGVADVETAEQLRDTPLYASPLDDPAELWVHELIGCEVVERDGRHLGVVDAVQANPASDLLVLEDGALIPLRFVVSSRPGESVTVDVPDGLLDLG